MELKYTTNGKLYQKTFKIDNAGFSNVINHIQGKILYLRVQHCLLSQK